MFDTVLIANRGEIACRIIATARKLGIHTIAIYSDADANARHVRLADAAYRVGGSPATESYLQIDNVLDVAQSLVPKQFTLVMVFYLKMLILLRLA